jgi:hypothetical protein
MKQSVEIAAIDGDHFLMKIRLSSRFAFSKPKNRFYRERRT